MPTSAWRRATGILALVVAASCGEPGGPGAPAVLRFAVPLLDLDTTRTAVVELENLGATRIATIELSPSPTTVAGSEVVVPTALVGVGSPVTDLGPSETRTVAVAVSVLAGTAPGFYEATVSALVDGVAIATVAIRFRVSTTSGTAEPASVAIVDPPASVRQGDVVALTAIARTASGAPIMGQPLTWSVATGAGLVDRTGRMVAYGPGAITIAVRAGATSDAVSIGITPRGLSGSFGVLGQGAVSDRFTSDLWVRGAAAYTGTWGCRTGPSGTICGNTLYVWDLTGSANPRLADSVAVDARTVNDVKVSADGSFAVITHEGSSDGKNGITLLSLTNPLAPRVITRHTDGLEGGVHNTWIEGRWVFAVANGAGLRIVDVGDPASPRTVASFHAGASFLHDVYVREGLAFLSHWDAGLVILDVGHGIAGGTPAAPIEVSRLAVPGGQVHNAWYWPAAGYVFVGEEDFSTPGIVHVVDVADLEAPREVATYAVAGVDPPHNFWVDETRGILYVGYYSNGLRAVDVSGRLLGELQRQGREIASIQYGIGTGCRSGSATCTWAPQLEGGVVYASDMNSGLWIFRPPQ